MVFTPVRRARWPWAVGVFAVLGAVAAGAVVSNHLAQRLDTAERRLTKLVAESEYAQPQEVETVSPDALAVATAERAAGLLRLDADEAATLEEALWDVRMRRVISAMAVLAQREAPYDLPRLLRRWGTDPVRLASAILAASDRHDLDPLLLVAIAWRESRFQASAKGDYRDGTVRSCGMTQVRVDFPARPTCEELLTAEYAVRWSAKHLAAMRDLDTGVLALAGWNGQRYENDVWRDVDAMRFKAGDRP